MPYVIEQTRLVEGDETQPGWDTHPEVVSRRAVGTLKEARDHAVELCRAAGPDLMAPLAASFTPEPGGVIDLPDGGRIEVRWEEDDE